MFISFSPFNNGAPVVLAVLRIRRERASESGQKRVGGEPQPPGGQEAQVSLLQDVAAAQESGQEVVKRECYGIIWTPV